MLLKETALVHALGITRIPLLFYCSPRVESATDEGCQIRIPLSWRTKNHLGSMYFGALAVGADLAGGYNAFRTLQRTKSRVALIFKDFQADFLKRADGDVLFTCTQGLQAAAAIAEAERTGERVTVPMRIVATVPSKYGDEPVANFVLGLSLKRSTR